MNLFLLEACLAAALLSASSALVGCFLLIRRRALLGDMIGHAVLPGLCVGFVLAGYEKNFFILLGGAFAAALLASFLQDLITRKSRIKADTSMALLLTGFYAVGVVILTYLQRKAGPASAGLDSFLLGSAATLSRRDLVASVVLLLLQSTICFVWLKELRAATFDPLFAATQGMRPKRYAQLISALTAVTVILALPAVGLILASALLILPAACASLITSNLGPRLWVSSLMGLILGFVGAWLSSLGKSIPTGPAIILLHSFVFFVMGCALYWWKKIQRKKHYV